MDTRQDEFFTIVLYHTVQFFAMIATRRFHDVANILKPSVMYARNEIQMLHFKSTEPDRREVHFGGTEASFSQNT